MNARSASLEMRVSAVIPAYDEGRTIGGVIAPLLCHPLIDEVIVVDDGSTDDTVVRAREAGATVISQPEWRQGLGDGTRRQAPRATTSSSSATVTSSDSRRR